MNHMKSVHQLYTDTDVIINERDFDKDREFDYIFPMPGLGHWEKICSKHSLISIGIL